MCVCTGHISNQCITEIKQSSNHRNGHGNAMLQPRAGPIVMGSEPKTDGEKVLEEPSSAACLGRAFNSLPYVIALDERDKGKDDDEEEEEEEKRPHKGFKGHSGGRKGSWNRITVFAPGQRLLRCVSSWR
eukprot:Skav228778  [mRNA]  locus=scaffold589:593293:595081:- [translate_table: standard]